MHPVRKKRLFVILIILVLLGAAISLVMYALQQNINLFYSPSQIATGEAPYNTNIRAGGMVVEGSVIRHPETLAVSFEVTDFRHKVRIEFSGILPDLFREGQGIVAQGQLNQNGVFEATQVLAKHDEKYMPPEVTEALENAQNSSLNETSNVQTTY
jgi:cytochrome c-type biogenesis protein CcmE